MELNPHSHSEHLVERPSGIGIVSPEDETHDPLRQQLEACELAVRTLTGRLAELDPSALGSALKSREGFVVELLKIIGERDKQVADLNRAVAQRDAKIGSLLFSQSWRLTKPLRLLGRVLRGGRKAAIARVTKMRATRAARILRQARIAAGYVVRGDFRGLIQRIRLRNQTCWGIVTTRHTLFVAHLIADRLRKHGWNVEIMTNVPAGFRHTWYVMLCPQAFKRIPPGEKRIVFQMEQSVSSRWFTDAYLAKLKNSRAVLEYSLGNLDFLASKGIAFPQVHYLPVGASATYGDSLRASVKTCDVLFYGDSGGSPRRQEMLCALKKRFNVRVVNELFGREMLEAIKQARLVVNLHYYENALLEMPRIQECLTLGVPVVSESAQDQGDYPELAGAVRFFEQGSIPAMLDAVEAVLEQPVPAEKIAESVERSSRRFAFMFDRALVAMGVLPASYVSGMSLPLPSSASRIALSLPETIGRRRLFEAERPDGCVVFDGIRSRPGWVGCGLSYAALARHAIDQGMSRINVMEDDVVLPPAFEAKMTVVNEFLAARSGQWDVFAGVIASLHPDAKVLSVEDFKGITFVTIDKMTSTVFNVYSESALRLLLSWNPEDLDEHSNTIDRFLERQTNLRVVVTLPFLVGHREDVHSTLWDFQNAFYVDMIADSERSLNGMASAYRQSPEYLTRRERRACA